MEYLVTMTTHVPAGTTDEAVADVRTREGAHTRELAAQGHVLRLWRPPLAPGEWRTLGLFAAADGDELERVLASMPLRVWRTDEVTGLGPHPNDPGAPRDRAAGERPPGREYLTVFTVIFPDGAPRRKSLSSPRWKLLPWLSHWRWMLSNCREMLALKHTKMSPRSSPSSSSSPGASAGP